MNTAITFVNQQDAKNNAFEQACRVQQAFFRTGLEWTWLCSPHHQTFRREYASIFYTFLITDQAKTSYEERVLVLRHVVSGIESMLEGFHHHQDPTTSTMSLVYDKIRPLKTRSLLQEHAKDFTMFSTHSFPSSSKTVSKTP